MNGWYVVYLIACGINGLMCAFNGFGLKTWQFWVWCALPVLAYGAGRFSC